MTARPAAPVPAPASASTRLSSVPAAPVALTVAGSDCCSGAGLQADLKVFSAHRVHGLTAVTCVVSEIPHHVSLIHPVPADVIADQLRLLLTAYPVAVVKTGMLYNAEIIRLTADALRAVPAARRPLLVVDPVMVATSGDPLITPDAVAAYQEILFPLATVITPNLDEASVLLGRPLRKAVEIPAAAAELHARHGCAVLLKGGHLRTAEAVDWLQDGQGLLTLSAPHIKGVSTHGTGCTYSSAIAAQLALGKSLRPACRSAKRFITQAIAESLSWGHGAKRVQALRQWR
ncbi:MAG: bifunctional hydroxymethylpyrimidine kinase/phosphomethylpyrimidine kinase [Verrucomicrobiaceae bacterium]|nr:MAG: bifunctional hydroxymethylpyrimidine kinase/phosphomethylpyrimidine kinase [Verrucomicrobiaceae bacterium]